MKPTRLGHIPRTMVRELKKARLKHGWSQLDLGHRVGLPQVHISNIETGKIVPRFDTLLDLVRVLGHDLVLVPRALVPVVQALVLEADRNQEDQGERPLYAVDDNVDEEDEDNLRDEV